MHCGGILEVRIWHYSSTPANVSFLVLKSPLFDICTQNCKYLKDAAGKTVVGEGLLCISGPLVFRRLFLKKSNSSVYSLQFIICQQHNSVLGIDLLNFRALHVSIDI